MEKERVTKTEWALLIILNLLPALGGLFAGFGLLWYCRTDQAVTLMDILFADLANTIALGVCFSFFGWLFLGGAKLMDWIGRD